MRGGPDTATLVRLAHESFTTSILPQLAGEARYNGLMIASALAMACREIEQGGGSEGTALSAAQAISAEGSVAPAGPEAERALARLIREGAFDSPEEAARLAQAIEDDNLAYLRLVNPALAGAQGG